MIKREGLGGKSSKPNWEDSEPGIVYLATSNDIAESYAESSDMVDADWLDEIVVFKVATSKLNLTSLKRDRNVIDGEDTYEYHGIIQYQDLVKV